ncbi:MAG TPA: histidinol-phosphate transaminase [Solirubrobacteraceae bacterium]|jgi:histidinol-phosphate aminotransferase|nr:histidinol-phosphate transaminase [Solirubrobacteraceae bacterium]
MGLLDYYRQFEGVPEEEVNRELREEAAERRRKALARVTTIDLSQTTWPGLPHANIVNAITFTARAGLQRYPHLRGSRLRGELAERHGVPAERLIIGNGVAELLSAATRALIGPGQELLTSWPSYPLFPLMARRAHGRAVPVDVSTAAKDGAKSPPSGAGEGNGDGGRSRGAGLVDALLAAVPEHRTRVVALASPNDPTGELIATAELRRLLAGLPEGIAVLLDEALVDFADTQPAEASIALQEELPHLLVFRSFSKAWGLAGLRVGYAIGGPGSGELLAELEPDLGVSELSQAGALEALRSGARPRERHVQSVCEERPRLTAELRARGFQVTDSQANFLWAAHPRLDGSELATRMERSGVFVAAGAGLGEPRHVRIALRDAAATDRVLAAVDKALG